MKTIHTTVLAFSTLIMISGCKKEFDTPPIRQVPVGSVLTIAELRALYTTQPVRFTEDRSVYGVVTADETSGNLYKEVYVQDGTAAINVRLLSAGGLYQGDSVRIYLPGAVLDSYQGMLQLDSVDVDNNVFKQATLVHKAPQVVTITQITPALQAQLVRLENVEFVTNELGQTYADAVNDLSVNHTITDCDENQIIIRTSGFADFAGQTLAEGNGSFIGVVGQFGSTMQLVIRRIQEVQFNDMRCTGVPIPPCPGVATVSEDFSTTQNNVDLDILCWKNIAQTGSRFWRGKIDSQGEYAQATSFQSSNASDISWLVVAPVDFQPGKTLSFKTQRSFGSAGHEAFNVYIATDFTGNNVSSANWTEIICPYATSATADLVWVQSGAVVLDGYLPSGFTGSFTIGFRYNGSGPNGQTTSYRVDDVLIQ